MNVECLCSSWGNGERECVCVCTFHGVVVTLGCLCSSWGMNEGECLCSMFSSSAAAVCVCVWSGFSSTP